MKVNMHEAKSQLSRLGRLAWEGEEIVIARAGEPWLRLEPYRERRDKRKLGVWKGQIRIAPDFDETPQYSALRSPHPRGVNDAGSGCRHQSRPAADGQGAYLAGRER